MINYFIQVSVKEHRHSLPTRVPGQNFSYSDHEPIEAIFEISAIKSNFNKSIVSEGKQIYIF